MNTNREKRIKELENRISELEMKLYALEMRVITHPISVPYAPPIIVKDDNNTGTPLPSRSRTIC